MKKAGSINQTDLKALPPANGDPVVPSEDQLTKAKSALTQKWASTVGG